MSPLAYSHLSAVSGAYLPACAVVYVNLIRLCEASPHACTQACTKLSAVLFPVLGKNLGFGVPGECPPLHTAIYQQSQGHVCCMCCGPTASACLSEAAAHSCTSLSLYMIECCTYSYNHRLILSDHVSWVRLVNARHLHCRSHQLSQRHVCLPCAVVCSEHVCLSEAAAHACTQAVASA
jgi:hypothetical protein